LTATETVVGEWRKVHKQKHHNFQPSHNNRIEIKKDDMVRECEECSMDRLVHSRKT
jgi:hypothetical protein